MTPDEERTLLEAARKAAAMEAAMMEDHARIADLERRLDTLSKEQADPLQALRLYICPVCRGCMTAAQYRAHIPGNHPPGAAEYHRQNGLNMQEGHLQTGLLDYLTGDLKVGR